MGIPSKQKAFQLFKAEEKGKRNTARVVERSVPQPSQNEVLVKVLAAGFNRRDEWSMMGAYPGLTFENSIMGCDGAGVVVSGNFKSDHPEGLVILAPSRGWLKDPTGPEAEVPGAPDSVRTNEFGGSGFIILGGTKGAKGAGMMQEYLAVDPAYLLPAPKHLSAVECATLPCAGVTSWRALFTKGRLQKGQNLLITGIGGGVAQLALQLAVAAGAHVFVTGGSEAKIQRAVSMGAVGGAVYKDAAWPKKIAALLPKDRPYLDVVLDSAGGDITLGALKAGIRQGGRIVVFGMTAAPAITFTMRDVLRNVELVGSTMGSNDELCQCLAFIEKHGIRPSIDTVIDGLESAHRGFELLANAEQRSAGKVVVKIAAEPRANL
ncbi:unnamed protein product [Tilletia controversa]|uniref:Enoyl reductase (ER) domain-containing protein n=1 Tax=Tilletia caries TaxID=13290 RepID=A0ABN7IL41_9BASI|nr:hypothetical protein CF336_g26 [Tilletia laevis]CAD6883899.1 unnamed protein product [Tilletia caries]CAD6928055.1 unnamed protein product [Tilletia controversa]CAD6903601.1 unnamed protein product [Tilletia caries]CAD6948719.1 unnamed protein product [Tilletia controversa]